VQREQDAERIALDIFQHADKTFDRAPPAPQERDAGGTSRLTLVAEP
jgi:hypothetical protein